MGTERTVVEVKDDSVDAARPAEVIAAEGYGARVIG